MYCKIPHQGRNVVIIILIISSLFRQYDTEINSPSKILINPEYQLQGSECSSNDDTLFFLRLLHRYI